MQNFILLFSDYTFIIVSLGSAILGIISGVLGCFSVIKKESLLGDGISHATLPGVVLAFLLSGSKSTEILLLGAFATGILAYLLINKIVKNSRIKFDSALAIIMSVFFGAGLVFLTYSQKIPNANQAGLNRFIYGQASTMLKSDVILIAACSGIILFITLLFWKEFKLISFDCEFAKIIGFNPNKLNLLLSFLTVVVIILGIQSVGAVLMSAMLIAPAVGAKQWSNRLGIIVLLSAIFGGISAVIGTMISSLVDGIPTGPIIVVCITAIAIFSILFAPKRGMLYRIYKQKKTRLQIKTKERQIL